MAGFSLSLTLAVFCLSGMGVLLVKKMALAEVLFCPGEAEAYAPAAALDIELF
jgi:hypothetical protein